MVEPQPTRAAYAQVVRDRDQAIAERDFILKFVQELGDALLQADAGAVAVQLHGLRGMAAVAARPDVA